ncbi:cytochrome b [Pseudooceanicola algae]|uniref:Cytochrome b561 n=1 Tax=Pseudooceanicola algae TaxID=1537215 RepID=A0A418SEN8_9RHOB|nr:cytochrome b/b6 domain-containing protein [Pseudooceanicola algae]QPM89831.1 Cytochrome b561 [Pseudooceanicola algae]
MAGHRQIGWSDNAEAYGRVTRLLHWGLAGLLVWQWLGMGTKVLLGRNAVSGFFVGLHAPVGTLIFCLVLIRILWTLASRNDRPAHAPGLVGQAAKAGHGLLYLLMLLVPSLALLRAFGSDRPFAPFGLLLHSGRETELAWMVAPANLAHGYLAWALLVLVTGHIAFAIYHQVVLKDGTLNRMAG